MGDGFVGRSNPGRDSHTVVYDIVGREDTRDYPGRVGGGGAALRRLVYIRLIIGAFYQSQNVGLANPWGSFELLERRR